MATGDFLLWISSFALSALSSFLQIQLISRNTMSTTSPSCTPSREFQITVVNFYFYYLILPFWLFFFSFWQYLPFLKWAIWAIQIFHFSAPFKVRSGLPAVLFCSHPVFRLRHLLLTKPLNNCSLLLSTCVCPFHNENHQSIFMASQVLITNKTVIQLGTWWCTVSFLSEQNLQS